MRFLGPNLTQILKEWDPGGSILTSTAGEASAEKTVNQCLKETYVNLNVEQ